MERLPCVVRDAHNDIIRTAMPLIQRYYNMKLDKNIVAPCSLQGIAILLKILQKKSFISTQTFRGKQKYEIVSLMRHSGLFVRPCSALDGIPQ